MACEHIAEQTNRQRDGSQQRGDDLDHPNKYVEREHDPLGREAFDVAPHAVVLHAHPNEVHERDECEGRGGGNRARTPASYRE